MFVENAGDCSHAALTAIIKKDLVQIQGDTYIKYNDQQIFYDSEFQIYILTQLANPAFSPEVQQSAKVLNFSVTREGLEQQLLTTVCHHESAKEEEEREKLARQNVLFARKKRETVNEILSMLRSEGSEILESDDFVNKLEESKTITQDINNKLQVAKHIEDRIEENRKIFKPVAQHGARLYFAIQDLAMLDPMYVFSMKWFSALFA